MLLIFMQLTVYEMKSSIKDLYLLWVHVLFLVRNIDQLEIEVEAGVNLYVALTVDIDVNCEEIYATQAEALMSCACV